MESLIFHNCTAAQLIRNTQCLGEREQEGGLAGKQVKRTRGDLTVVLLRGNAIETKITLPHVLSYERSSLHTGMGFR